MQRWIYTRQISVSARQRRQLERCAQGPLTANVDRLQPRARRDERAERRRVRRRARGHREHARDKEREVESPAAAPDVGRDAPEDAAGERPKCLRELEPCALVPELGNRGRKEEACHYLADLTGVGSHGEMIHQDLKLWEGCIPAIDYLCTWFLDFNTSQTRSEPLTRTTRNL